MTKNSWNLRETPHTIRSMPYQISLKAFSSPLRGISVANVFSCTTSLIQYNQQMRLVKLFGFLSNANEKKETKRDRWRWAEKIIRIIFSSGFELNQISQRWLKKVTKKVLEVKKIKKSEKMPPQAPEVTLSDYKTDEVKNNQNFWW